MPDIIFVWYSLCETNTPTKSEFPHTSQWWDEYTLSNQKVDICSYPPHTIQSKNSRKYQSFSSIVCVFAKLIKVIFGCKGAFRSPTQDVLSKICQWKTLFDATQLVWILISCSSAAQEFNIFQRLIRLNALLMILSICSFHLIFSLFHSYSEENSLMQSFTVQLSLEILKL